MRLKLLVAILIGTFLFGGLAALAADEAPKPETKITVRVFADFTWKEIKSDTGYKTDATGIGPDVKRFYLGVGTKFDAHWSAQFLSDIGDQTSSKYDVYIKNAYIQYSSSPAFNVRLGATTNPWEAWEDGTGLQNTRYIEAPPTDRLGLANSADWGLHFLGKSGTIGYQVSLVNGKGYSITTRTKTVDFEGLFTVAPTKEFQLGIGAYSGKRGYETENNGATNTANRIDMGAMYKTDTFGIFAEYWAAKNWNNVTPTSASVAVKDDKSDGFAGTLRFNFNPKFGLFARYDQNKPSKDLYSDVKNTLAIAALEYRPIKGVAVSLVYKQDKWDNVTVSGDGNTTSNGAAAFTGFSNGFSFYKSTYITPSLYKAGNNVKAQEIGIYCLYDF